MHRDSLILTDLQANLAKKRVDYLQQFLIFSILTQIPQHGRKHLYFSVNYPMQKLTNN